MVLFLTDPIFPSSPTTTVVTTVATLPRDVIDHTLMINGESPYSEFFVEARHEVSECSDEQLMRYARRYNLLQTDGTAWTMAEIAAARGTPEMRDLMTEISVLFLDEDDQDLYKAGYEAGVTAKFPDVPIPGSVTFGLLGAHIERTGSLIDDYGRRDKPRTDLYGRPI